MATLPKPKPASLQAVATAVRGKKLSPLQRRSLPSQAENNSSVAAAQAKAHFSELLAQVEHDRKPILITKRGRVVAQLVPAPEEKPISNFDRIFGSMRGTVRITGDIVSPDWEAWGPEWR